MEKRGKMSVYSPTMTMWTWHRNFTELILTLSKSAKSDNSSQRFLITFWYSASRVGLQSPLPSIIVALNAIDKFPLTISMHFSFFNYFSYPCNRNPFDRGIHCYRYLFCITCKSVKGNNKKRDSDLIWGKREFYAFKLYDCKWIIERIF